ncbi:YhcH/YjgK/YiaL domain protein [Fusobacterium sp. oral taxon 370 str. F0437]|uniref:YhcH/YjgK/YiaL family protein n=1 Tax=Fusobacterium sp. oral taxon 370 TaxID=712288 RepID=UPI000234A411|nr:YhcH/YjgK/YiaL family protein [Fusobacterium sp. oral taxon 370]EHI76379.1 YhcH/YjgK/YiaL domain protein [Fusobacterium sp. oral taxon 370 str. F0437]
MIYAELKDIKNYKGINENLDKAIDFITEKKYLNASFGKNIVDGDKIYFNHPEKPMTRENTGLELEYHKKYVDIHIILEGEEALRKVSKYLAKEGTANFLVTTLTSTKDELKRVWKLQQNYKIKI